MEDSIFNAEFWVGVAFFIFIGFCFYFGLPKMVSNLLNKYSEDLRSEIKKSSDLVLDSENAKKNCDKILSDFNKQIDDVKLETQKMLQAYSEKMIKEHELFLKRQEDLLVLQIADLRRESLEYVTSVILNKSYDIIRSSVSGNNITKVLTFF